MYTLTGKPNSLHDSADGEKDDHFLRIIKRSYQEPVREFEFPQTEAQEVGWNYKPLLPQDREDRRLNVPRKNSDYQIHERSLAAKRATGKPAIAPSPI